MAYQLLNIGGIDLTPYIKGYKVSKYTQVTNAERNVKGNLTYDYVGFTYKIEVTTRPLTPTELYVINNCLRNYEVTVQFYNPLKNALVGNEVMYHNDLSPGLMFWSSTKERTQEFSFNLIGVNCHDKSAG